jgi:hypothetical protein
MKFKNDIEAQAGFKDAGGDLGVAGQLLSSTGTETNWVDASTVIGGPYLPLSAGSSYPLTGDVFINSNYTGSNAAANDLTIGKTTTGNHGITIATGPTYTGSIYFGDSDNNDAGIIGYQHSDNSNVGIGTTSPGEKLDVAGDILINGITIGRGSGNVSSNTASGYQALYSNTTGDLKMQLMVIKHYFQIQQVLKM